MTDDTPSLDSASVTAILAQRGREDQAALLDDLVMLFAETVPGVKVERSLLRRHVTAIRMPLGAHVYMLKRGAGEAFEACRQQEVRGVVIRTDPMEIDEFLAALGPALDAELQRTERGRDALRDWMNSRNS